MMLKTFWMVIISILQTSDNFNKLDTAQFIVASLSVFQEQSRSGTSRYARYCRNRDFTTCNRQSQMEKEETLSVSL